MKRTLLLVILFLGLVGCGIMALTLSSGGSHKRIVLDDASGADAIESRIIHEWSIAEDWDKALYNDLKDQIQMSRSADLITPSQEEQLLDLNCARASLVIVPKAEKEFKKANCNRGVIAKCSDGISTLKKDGFSNVEITKIENCCNVYFQILNMVGSVFDPGFQVRGGRMEWHDYKDYVTDQEEKVLAFQGNDIYQTYLSGITDLKEGLSNRVSYVKNGALDYYVKVFQAIKAYCNEYPGTDSAMVTSASSRFRQQVAGIEGGPSLAGQLDQYVKNNY